MTFHYTLKAWGKTAGRVRCFERRAVTSCLLPLLRQRRQAAMQTLAKSNLLAILPDEALGRLADAARENVQVPSALSRSHLDGKLSMLEDVLLVQEGAVWITGGTWFVCCACLCAFACVCARACVLEGQVQNPSCNCTHSRTHLSKPPLHNSTRA